MWKARRRYDSIERRLVEEYQRATAGATGWLSYHLHPEGPSLFGGQLLAGLSRCEQRIPGLAAKLVNELALIRYVPTRSDPAAWRAGFQQLLQKFAEIVVLGCLFDANWPDGTTFQHEPANPKTGRRPEASIETATELFLVEVKCPALLEHQERRSNSPRQVPARGVAGDALRASETNRNPEEAVTWPRDNVMKDFLVSAEEKFVGFRSAKRTVGVLVVVWDAYLYEPISSLLHSESGLFTDASFVRQANGERTKFEAVDGVIIMNHLAALQAGAQELPLGHRIDPFSIEQGSPLPNVWCGNTGAESLDSRIAAALDVVPVEDQAHAADYQPQDFIVWMKPARP